MKHVGLAVWSPETYMSSGGFSFLLFKDQEMIFLKETEVATVISMLQQIKNV